MLAMWVGHPPRRQRLAALAYLLGWFCIPLALYFLVLQQRPSFEPRYLIAVTPALLLLWAPALNMAAERGAGDEVQRITRHAQRVVHWVVTLTLTLTLVAVIGIGAYTYTANAAALKDDSAGVVHWLASETTPDDRVYVDTPHPFHYYADRIPAPLRYLFVDIHTAAADLTAEVAGRRRVYWVTWYGSDTDPRGVVPFLFDKVAPRGGERDFRGYHVTWWELPRGGVQLSLPDNLTPVDLVFGEVLRVDGVAYGATCRAGDATWATLHFALIKDTGVDYRASLRLRDAAGDMLPPTDRDVLNDRHLRTSAWPVEDVRLNQAVNVYTLPVPPSATPGDYRLELVVYDAATLAGLPVAGVVSADGVSAFLGTVNVRSP
jgi:mannosyltransferase